MTIDFSDIENNIATIGKNLNRLEADTIRANNDSLGEIMRIKERLGLLPKKDLIEKIDKAISELLEKDYSPIINVEVDNKEIVTALKEDNQSIIILLTEIKDMLRNRPTGFQFDRDNQGFIKSPIKITYGSR